MFHAGVGEEYLAQFASEHQVWETSGRGVRRKRQLVWRPKKEGAENHYLDCEVVAAAIADYKGLMRLKSEPPEGNFSPPESGNRMRRFGKGPMGYKARKLTS